MSDNAGSNPLDSNQFSSDFPSYTSRHNRPRVEPMPVLEAAEQVTVSIDMLREQYDSIVRICAANEWREDEGLLTVLMAGLGYLDATLQIEAINRTEELTEVGQRVDSLVQDLAAYHSMYAVMKYKAFKLYKISQTLEFNVAGLRASERMWEEWAERMRREQAELRSEVLRLKSVLGEFTVEARNPDGQTEERRLTEMLPSMSTLLEAAPAPRDLQAWDLAPKAYLDAGKPRLPSVEASKPQPDQRPSFWARLFRWRR